MPFDIKNDVKKVRNNVIKGYFVKYALLCILFLKFFMDAIYQNSPSAWIFLLTFLYLVYLLYSQKWLAPGYVS